MSSTPFAGSPDEGIDLAEYNGGALVGTTVSFLVITYISVFLRCYVRTFLTNGFQVDDWLMLVAQVRNHGGRRNVSWPSMEPGGGLLDLGAGIGVVGVTRLEGRLKVDFWRTCITQAIFTLSCAFVLRGVYEGLGHHNAALADGPRINSLMVSSGPPLEQRYKPSQPRS